jgi:LysM repeat protein
MIKKVLLVLGLVLVLQLLWVPAGFAAPLWPPHHGGHGGPWHTVQWGETLSSIGWRYGVSSYAICAANGLANCNFIYAGQRLRIPGGGPGPVSPCSAYHTVRWGENLTWIANWYGVSPWSIGRANGIQNPDWIYAGQTLCIP